MAEPENSGKGNDAWLKTISPETVITLQTDPETSGSFSGKAEPETNGEPVPEWSKAISTWGVAWDIHQYGLGAMFAILAVLSFASFIRVLRSTRGTKQRKVSALLLILLTGYGASRCLFLCVDAYNHKHLLPKAALNLIWGIAQPCLVTAYTLLFVVLRNALLLKQRFQSWFTTRNILLVVVPHFMVVLIAELAISFSPSLKILTFICQLLYTILSLLLAVFYASVSVLIRRSLHAMNAAKGNSKEKSTNRMGRVLSACIAAAIGGLAIAVGQIYAMAGTFSVFSKTQYVAPWSWYSFNTVLRLLEVYLAVVLFVLAHHQSGRRGRVRKMRVAEAPQSFTLALR